MAEFEDEEWCWVSRSLLDSRVWVPHIPNSDIATSEGHAAASLRLVKAYVEEKDGTGGTWVRSGPDAWLYQPSPT